MMFFVKIILFYSYISFLIVKEKSTYFDKFYLLLITFAHIYFGVARGTNYELFELMILFVFVILYKSKRVRSIKIPLKNVLIVSLVGIIMIYLFYNRIADRGVVFDFSKSRDFIYDPEGVIATIFPLLSYITLLVYDYFGFGFYYLSIYISHVWFQSIGNFFAGLFPFGYTFIENSKIQEIMPNYVEMGPRWHPDTAILINNLGFIGLLILGTILGSCAKFTFREGNNSSLTYLTQFIILLQIISLPIGNFVFISSASTLIVMLISFIWFWKIFIKVKIKL